MNIPATTTIQALMTDLSATGIAIPVAAVRWLDVRDRLAANYEDEREDLQAVVDRLEPDNITAIVDDLVRRRVEAGERRRATAELTEAAAGKAVRAIRGESDSILASARKGFDKAAKVITDNAHAYSPGEAAADVLGRGDAATTAWTAIRDASRALDGYLQLWSNLYGAPVSTDAVVATYDGDHWRRVDAADAFASPARWHALVAQGVALRLNTYTEVLAIDQHTPYRELRAEVTSENGFHGVRMGRQPAASTGEGLAF